MPSFSSKTNETERGQSFVELSLVVIFLMIFVAGVIEFGFMLNNYLNLVDASREAVRYSSDSDPFENGPCTDRTNAACINPQFYTNTINLTEDVLAPVELDSTNGDDIVISFFSVANGYYKRFPDNNGQSYFGNQASKLTNAEIQSRLDSSAPPTGVLLIEIFYHYPQVLKLPVFTAFVQDPMPVYVYSIMPLSAAEPAPTPTP